MAADSNHPAPGAREGQPLVLYSFRRCPYAIRARLALAAAGFRPGENLELREVRLKAKPPELLDSARAVRSSRAERTPDRTDGPSATAARGSGTATVAASTRVPGSTTGPRLETVAANATDPALATVPLLLADGLRLPESLPIITWALERRDPQGWLQGWSSGEREAITALIAENDGPFKRWLDRYRYGERGGGNEPRHAARTQALAILRSWSALLARGGWLLGDRPSLADLALLPFVRQFRLSDPGGFDNEAGLAPLQQWLAQFLRSPALAAVMEIPWAPRCPWPSPRWLYHLALADDWREARAAGTYRHSSRGLSLEAAGFVHACQAHQIASTLERFYGDLPKDALRLLAIDPDRLAQAGVEVRWEAAPESGEPFPHLYGGLPLEAVLWSEVPGR